MERGPALHSFIRQKFETASSTGSLSSGYNAGIMINVRTDFIGPVARQVLLPGLNIRVLGNTSRGIFLAMPSGWAIFLSNEKYPGPLTINLGQYPQAFSTLEPGDPVRLMGSNLEFGGHPLRVNLSGAREWTPPARPEAALPDDQVRERIAWTIQHTLAEEELFSEEELIGLAHGLKSGQVEEVVKGLVNLLGRGPGLTPAGDDLASGLLLALNRWKENFPTIPVVELGERLVFLAANRTTMLSANLIACAQQGLADERLILALDGLVAGTLEVETCAAYLRGWGHTSGGSALLGMAVAFGKTR
jgi:hypothetical protein